MSYHTKILSLAILSLVGMSFASTSMLSKVDKEIKIHHGTSEESHYTYDGKGRVESMIRSNPPLGLQYTYHGDSVIVTDVRHRIIKYVYTLDAGGHAKSENESGPYVYDKDGNLVYYVTWPGAKHYRQIAEGDVIADSSTGDAKSRHTVDRYTYYSYEDYRDYGESYKGRRNTHLVKSHIRRIDQKLKSMFDTLNYTYKFDRKGRVDTEYRIHSPNDTTTVSYTYY